MVYSAKGACRVRLLTIWRKAYVLLRYCSLWSRLIIHFWALETERELLQAGVEQVPNPVEYLQRAYDRTISATSSPNEWQGTTTACTAIVQTSRTDGRPVLYATNLGDSQVLVIRPNAGKVIYKTTEQWHWFDCPRQLGTNSPDTPRKDAVMDRVPIQEHDVVLAMSDGVTDNLWGHEMVHNVIESLREWEKFRDDTSSTEDQDGPVGAMDFVAQALVKAARVVAEDPFAESPFMERAVEEGLAMAKENFTKPKATKQLNDVSSDTQNLPPYRAVRRVPPMNGTNTTMYTASDELTARKWRSNNGFTGL
ncbi:MAG: hypothetical protein M1816_006437 [Peltula sp. TS41687]|nr:MAG: hypothetical protein M1816_006437 [Peltula sp. TS41687]